MSLPMVEARSRRVQRVVRDARQVLGSLTFEVGVEPKPTIGVVATGAKRALARRQLAPCGIPLPVRPVLIPASAVLTVGVIGGVPVPCRLLRSFPTASSAPTPGTASFPLPFLMATDTARPTVRPPFVP